MGPKNQYTAQARDFDESDIEKTDEYIKFLAEIKALHESRNSTQFHNPEPDIQRKKIDLLKLYKKVTEAGGYTKVSEQTGLWKEFAVQFNPPQHNSNIGFVLKSIYKNNLGAWECKQYWGRDPPPKEALEELTAAGSELLDRKPPEVTESPGSSSLPTRGRSTAGGAGESPGSAVAGAATTPSGRSLREAPPKRQFFQPELNTPKQRSSSAHQTPPSSFSTSNGKPATMSFTSGGHGNTPSMPSISKLTISAVETPYSHPSKFPTSGIMYDGVRLTRDSIHSLTAGMPSVRARRILDESILRLMCGIPTEVTEGLRFLLAASAVEENAILFKHAAPFADNIISKIAEGLSTIRLPKDQGPLGPWDPKTFDPKKKFNLATFNTLVPSFETKEWRDVIDPVFNTALVLRNLTFDNDENAAWLVEFVPTSIPTLLAAWNLPDLGVFAEFRLNCLETLTAMSKFILVKKHPNLMASFWDCIRSEDRNPIILGLTAVTRLSIRDETKQIDDVPADVLERITRLLMIPDTEILVACLDFLYSYTLNEDSAIKMIEDILGVAHLENLTRLLSYGATEFFPQRTITTTAKVSKKELPEMIPELPKDLANEINAMAEPNRAVVWMRTCFAPNPESEITQIALWQSYQLRFAPSITQGPRPQPLLHANDFIKNVNIAFKNAHAMMLPASGGQPQRFVIRGIAPRETPMAPDGTSYLKCEWRLPKPKIDPKTGTVLDPKATVACGQFFKEYVALGEHVRDKHTFLRKDSDVQEQRCDWKKCTAFHETPTKEKYRFFKHILAHVKPVELDKKKPESKDSKPASPAADGKANEAQAAKKPGEPVQVDWYTQITDVDKRGQPCGVAFMAARVMTNLGKAKTELCTSRLSLFKPVICQKAVDNPVLCATICDILVEITTSEQVVKAAAGEDPMAM